MTHSRPDIVAIRARRGPQALWLLRPDVPVLLPSNTPWSYLYGEYSPKPAFKTSNESSHLWYVRLSSVPKRHCNQQPLVAFSFDQIDRLRRRLFLR